MSPLGGLFKSKSKARAPVPAHCFDFTHLPLQVQLRTLEHASYCTLKTLERVNKSMKKLIGTRTPQLDAALYRTRKVNKKQLCTSQKYMNIHPVLLAMCAQRGDKWKDVDVSALEGRGKSAKRSGTEVKLCKMKLAGENATEPPTRHLHIFSELEHCTTSDKTVTVKDFVERLLTSLDYRHPCPKFAGFEGATIDKKGCITFYDPLWVDLQPWHTRRHSSKKSFGITCCGGDYDDCTYETSDGE